MTVHVQVPAGPVDSPLWIGTCGISIRCRTPFESSALLSIDASFEHILSDCTALCEARTQQSGLTSCLWPSAKLPRFRLRLRLQGLPSQRVQGTQQDNQPKQRPQLTHFENSPSLRLSAQRSTLLCTTSRTQHPRPSVTVSS